ncbi:hypothetical protein NFI96_020205 [Prochilodus magdalenae]|nr:hypothetical protein NFI96_020205 [Prochilodus magdalenae]
MGVSRSATLVLAFLMICEELTLMEAARAVRQHRDICPNPGFLNQLRHLDIRLIRERKRKLEAYKFEMVVACSLSYEGGAGETCMAGCLKGLIPCRDTLMGWLLKTNLQALHARHSTRHHLYLTCGVCCERTACPPNLLLRLEVDLCTRSIPSNNNLQRFWLMSKEFKKKMKSTASKQSTTKSAYKPLQCDPDSQYITPGVFELEKLFWRGSGAEYTHVNEVWPGVYIGDEKTALERHNLEKTGITHILNAAEGKWNNVATGPDYYHGMNIDYYGVEAEDIPTFNLSQFFYPAAQFIDRALSSPEKKFRKANINNENQHKDYLKSSS